MIRPAPKTDNFLYPEGRDSVIAEVVAYSVAEVLQARCASEALDPFLRSFCDLGWVCITNFLVD